MADRSPRISVVTPTLGRTAEVRELVSNLAQQTVAPWELLIVDGSRPGDRSIEQAIEAASTEVPFRCHYIRQSGGTAVQRNAGIERAGGDYIAFVDDDIRLEPSFFETILGVFEKDTDNRVGGITGYITNQHLNPVTSRRWQWYRRLHLFTTYEPGRYDYHTGYPINRYLQQPHDGTREIDFMGAGCAVWRTDVCARGLRFADFFTDYGMLEDAHFALRARRDWTLLECGTARCTHLRSTVGRVDKCHLAWKSAVNYRFVFVDIVPRRTWRQETRFWTVQTVDLARYVAAAVRTSSRDDWRAVGGKLSGIRAAWRIQPDVRAGATAVARESA